MRETDTGEFKHTEITRGGCDHQAAAPLHAHGGFDALKSHPAIRTGCSDRHDTGRMLVDRDDSFAPPGFSYDRESTFKSTLRCLQEHPCRRTREQRG